MTDFDFTVPSLGDPLHDSPLLDGVRRIAGRFEFVTDEQAVPLDITVGRDGQPPSGPRPCLEKAGARRKIFFDPARVRAAVATCGGLCPGLNDVIRAIVMELHYAYGIDRVLGLRYGYAGLRPDPAAPPIELDPESVSDIHRAGGSILGASRDRVAVDIMVDRLVELGVSTLFLIGGDGTLRGAHAISREILRRGLPIAVVGVPKTIDNDIELVYRSFGFETAVEQARHVLDCAHTESKGVDHGIGLVKLMGRDSGFIAAHAALASGDVNLCLVPEIPFQLWGDDGILPHLRDRLNRRRHAVIALAEGAGRHLLDQTDTPMPGAGPASRDIGIFVREAIERAFHDWGEPVNIKYFDPSYLIRSVPADSQDSIYCAGLGRNAAHAAMAGKTDLMIGLWHGVFTHVPLSAVAGRRRTIDPRGGLWRSVLAATGQPIQSLTTPAH
jgi:6-phosphofructokinase 1